MPRGVSPLELLLPDGVASHAVVLGSACPDGLRPPSPPPGPEARADLIVLAPERRELVRPGWLDRCVDDLTSRLAPDGVVYVLAPRRWRSRVAKDLSRRGLVTATTLLHDPDTETSRSLVPLAIGPATYAFASLIPTRPSRRRLALLALRSPGGRRLLARVLPSVGFAARRPEARPLLDWVSRLDGMGVATEAVISVSWRGQHGSLVVHPFPDGAARPRAIVKIGAAAPASHAQENDVIRRLGADARRAGVEVPRPIAAGRLDDRDLLVQSAVNGRSCASVLGDSPQMLREVCGALVEWIEAWNLATRRTSPLSAQRLEDELTRPARHLAHGMAGGDRYVRWLEARCAASAGQPLPFVAAHHDLTMVNVFVDPRRQLGVVDWEAGGEDCLPLVDFYYAVVDATAAAARYADRVASFEECFGENATESPARRLEERLRTTLGISRDHAELCFHACWIRYASHEDTVVATGGPRPFLEILRRLAALSAVG